MATLNSYETLFAQNPALAFLLGSTANGFSNFLVEAPTITPMLTGTTGNDLLTGTSGNDTLDGSSGNDTLTGLDGDDSLLGGTGSDSLSGGNGNDTLGGYSSSSYDGFADTLVGGAGNDTYYISAEAYNSTIGYITLDTVTEAVNGGTDTVVFSNSYSYYSSASYSLGSEIENLILSGSSSSYTFTGIGNALNNIITGRDSAYDSLVGGDGDDTLNGGLQTGYSDTLVGGAGSDTYIIDTGTYSSSYAGYVTITEDMYAGIDTVELRGNYSYSYSYTLGSNIENAIVTSSSSGYYVYGRYVIGNSLNNSMTGGYASDTLSGLDGNDTLSGLDGNDSLSGGTGSDSLSGGYGDDSLTGGADSFSDTLSGGLGNDTYYLSTEAYDSTAGYVSLDTIFESVNGGTDTVVFSNAYSGNVSYTLGGELENLSLAGSSSYILTGIGNSLNNVLTGRDSGYDSLVGGDGNDTLNGGILSSANYYDTLTGGIGNDTYVIDTSAYSSTYASYATIVENSDEGTDTVELRGNSSSTSIYTLGNNIENLLVTAGTTYGRSVYGNSLDNLMTGASGADTFYGSTGNDTLLGGDGSDYLDGGDGNNSLSGGTGSDSLRGGTGNDSLTGGNDSSADTLVGGSGDDTYYISAEYSYTTYSYTTLDTITESASGGTDTVVFYSSSSGSSYTLGSELENLTLNGYYYYTQTGIGNTLNNVLTGRDSGYDSLVGGDGNDTLNGGLVSYSYSDTLVGGAGDDTYLIDTGTNSGYYANYVSVVEDVGAGTDTVELRGNSYSGSYYSYTLSANIENVIVTNGTVSAGSSIYGRYVYGNTLNNAMTGGLGADTFYASTGDDTLNGGGGNDSLNGGDGLDSLVGGAGDDSLYANSFIETSDNSADVLLGGTGNDSYYITTGDKITELVNEGTDTVYYGGTQIFALATNLENIYFVGTGTSGITIYGNTGNNLMVGRDGVGTDTLSAGDGNDSIFGGGGSDVLAGGNGDDVAGSIHTITGNIHDTEYWLNSSSTDESGNDSLYGGAGNDWLGGGTGIDKLDGGDGNDWLGEVDTSTADTLIGGLGIDTVQLDLSDAESNIAFTFTGTQTLVGKTLSGFEDLAISLGAGNDSVTGGVNGDTIFGGFGNDSLSGGAGDDLIGDNDGIYGIDTLIGGAGNDTVYVNLADEFEGLNWTLSSTQTQTIAGNTISQFEAVSLELGSGADTVTGGSLNDQIYGNDGNNSLSGGAGDDVLGGGDDSDTLLGGSGNDTLTGGDSSDRLEGGDGDDFLGFLMDSGYGNDTLLGGAGNDSIYGGYNNDWLEGGDGNDTLNAGSGQDTIQGGAGDDTFLLNTCRYYSSSDYTDTVVGGLGSDSFVLTGDDYYSSYSSTYYTKELIRDFSSGTDKLKVDMSIDKLAVGDGDNLVEGAVRLTGSGGFAASAELVIITKNMGSSQSLESSYSAAQIIGSATSNYAVGNTALFVVDNGGSSAVYRFESQDTDALVESYELDLLAVLGGNASTQITDYAFIGS
jgi:Ca2+-binding RTX toxin-like protein